MKPGLLIYAGGLGSLFLSDIFVARGFSHADITSWSQLRSLLGIVAVLPLIGLDQVLVRSPAASAQILRIMLLQVPLLGTVLGVVLQVLGLVDEWWIGAGLSIGSAVSLVQFQYFRSHHYQVLSQLAQQGWKIAAFALVLVMMATGWRGDLMLLGVVLILGLDVFMAAAIFAFPPERLHPQNDYSITGHYEIGTRFMVTGIMLALSVYAEQLVVNRLGTGAEAALYFTSSACFLFPISFFNGYFAFIIGPWIRNKHDIFITLIQKRWMKILFCVIMYCLTMSVIGSVIWKISSPSVGAADVPLQLLLVWTAIARTLYLLPSGYFGVFGKPRQHDVLIVLQVLAVGPVFAVFAVLRGCGFDLVHSVAAASALNTSLRTIVGFFMIPVVARSHVEGAAL